MTQKLCIAKRGFFIIVSLCLAFVGQAEDIELNGIAYSIDSSEGIPSATVIQKPGGYKDEVIIPERINFNDTEYLVTAIGDSAFKECYQLWSIILPKSITRIGSYSFYYCLFIRELNLPVNLASIGTYAFGECHSLVNITLPESISCIEEFTFVGCTSLSPINLSVNITQIKRGAFNGCPFTSVVIPSRIKAIEPMTFMSCTYLESVEFPEELESIGDSAFDGCRSLKDINLPKDLKSIGKSAFAICDSLSSITIPDGITTIPEDAFWGCRKLASIILPRNLTNISAKAFTRCSELKSITLRTSTPPDVLESSFQTYDATLYVPIGSSEAYKADAIWGKFAKIEEYNPSSVTEVISDSSSDGITIFLPSPGTLSIVSAKSQSIALCNASGILLRMISLKEGENLITNLAPGLYLVGGQKVVVQ